MDLENPKAFTDRKHFTPTPPKHLLTLALVKVLAAHLAIVIFS